MGVGADAEERRVSKADQSRVARQHHEREAAEPVDEHEADVDQVRRHQERHDQQTDQEGCVPVALDAVAEELEVLGVGGFEENAHASDLFPGECPENALRPDREHDEQDHVRGNVLEPLR